MLIVKHISDLLLTLIKQQSYTERSTGHKCRHFSTAMWIITKRYNPQLSNQFSKLTLTSNLLPGSVLLVFLDTFISILPSCLFIHVKDLDIGMSKAKYAINFETKPREHSQLYTLLINIKQPLTRV